MNDIADQGLDGIAIVSMAGRFPKAPDLQTFWQNLCAGVEGIDVLTDDELSTLGVPESLRNHPDYVKAYANIVDFDQFDAAFFGMSAREATIMDPQQRLLLECAWETLERAGYDPAQYDGTIGIYASASIDTYTLYNLYPNRHTLLQSVGFYQLRLANRIDHLATRVGYKLNLRGPCVTLQTSCSSSLVATHLACQNLLTHQADMMLVGGVTINTQPKAGYLYQEGMIFSPDGHCRAFDAEARGTVSGGGIGVVLLKRLEDALADRDTILAVIKGSAINNDGAVKIGYTAPSVSGQTEVIAMAQAMAGCPAETITYIEAHGTATPLGDPIEFEALTKAFQMDTRKKHFCALGSVKTNIGHLDAAAGIAGLIKTTLALHHQMIPPSLHFKQANPEIDLANSPFYVNTSLIPWTSSGPRRAGVSSFGVGGTNAHLVLEEAPVMPPTPSSSAWQLLCLSAQTPTALQKMTDNLIAYLQTSPTVNMADVAYTLMMGRKRFPYRRVVLCQTAAEAVTTLGQIDTTPHLTAYHDGSSRPLAYLFPGQGTQYVQMGYELYEQVPLFRQVVDRCAAELWPYLGVDIRTLLFPTDGFKTEAEVKLAQTEFAQPAIFVISYALAQLWFAWGVRPQAMIGHSLGEYVAACLAGVMTLSEALMVVAKRGKLMQALPAGKMIAVYLPASELASYLPADSALAAVNRPNLCIVSGTNTAVATLAEYLTRHKIQYRYLDTSHAFHSAMMDSILEPLTAVMRQVQLKPPQIPYISNVTGKWITAVEATSAAYWAQHTRQTVRFYEGLTHLVGDDHWVLLEVGPGESLRKASQQVGTPPTAITRVSSLVDNREQAGLLESVGQLWLAGVSVQAKELYTDESRRVPLPTYPFERQSYWIEASRAVFYNEADSSPDAKEAASAPSASFPTTPLSSHQRSSIATRYHAPQSTIEKEISYIWQHVLGIDQIGIHDNFFELGGDSVIAVQAISQLRQLFSQPLPQNILLEAPTIYQLSRWSSQDRGVSTLAKPLVLLQAGATATPLFLIHAVGGTVYSYQALLPHFLPTQAVYGLRALGLEANEGAPLETIEQMAEVYLDAVRSVQPNGPYHLGGYSFGGLVAFAIAQQLLEYGEMVAFLSMIDTPGPGQMPAAFVDDAGILAYIYHTFTNQVIEADTLRQMETTAQLTHLITQAKHAQLLPADFSLEQAQRLLNIWKANLQAMHQYQPAPYAGHITFFRAQQRRRRDPQHPEYAWLELSQGGIEIYTVPGNHITMFLPPHVSTLGQQLGHKLAHLSED